MGKFELYKDKASEFRFRLKAGNGQIILVSEGYTTKANCENGIASVKENSQIKERFEVKEVPTGIKFSLKAGNWQIIGQSEVYTNKSCNGKLNRISYEKCSRSWNCRSWIILKKRKFRFLFFLFLKIIWQNKN